MENINSLAKYLQATILEKILNNIPENAKLEKKEISGTIIYKSPEVECEKYNISRCLYFDKYNEIIIKFTKMLEYNFPHCNLSSFYKNMETAEITVEINNLIRKLYKLLGYKGLYFQKNNKILLMRHKSMKEYEDTLSHELLHLASFKKVGKIYFGGFSQYSKNKKYRIGRYLNEGYTEYLNQKYFTKEKTTSYSEVKDFAQCIERIIGTKKMEKLYFDSNLNGLIEELEKYSSKENIINLIKKIDFYYEQVILSEDNNKLIELDKELRKEISNIYYVKISKELTEGKISEEEFEKRKLLYCDEYEVYGRVYSDDVVVSRNWNCTQIFDLAKDEAHYNFIENNFYEEEEEFDISKANSLEALLQMVSPEEQIAIDELKKKQETENLKK